MDNVSIAKNSAIVLAIVPKAEAYYLPANLDAEISSDGPWF